ncbi:MAG: GtrA family protein [Polaromonas sp.]
MYRHRLEPLSCPRLGRQALAYLLVGGRAAVVDIGLFHALVSRFEGVLMPAITSFLVAAVVNYSLSSIWVYRRQWRSVRRATTFLLFALIGLPTPCRLPPRWPRSAASALPFPPTS